MGLVLQASLDQSRGKLKQNRWAAEDMAHAALAASLFDTPDAINRSGMSSRHRKFLTEDDESDPLSGLTNLFDIAMVFALALVALAQRLEMSELLTERDVTIVKNPGSQDMEIVIKEGAEIKTYRVGDLSEQAGQQGRRVGSAFELEDGTIIYVPDAN